MTKKIEKIRKGVNMITKVNNPRNGIVTKVN